MEMVTPTEGSFTTSFDEWAVDSRSSVQPIEPGTVVGQLKIYDFFIPILGILIIVMNLTVVISSGLILKRGQQPRSTYLFLGNVAMADLVTGFAVLFGQYYPKQYRDETSCAIQMGMIVSSTLASCLSVGLIAFDRFLYILHGLQYQRWVYPTRARLLIVTSWVIGCLIGFLPAMGWSGNTDNGRFCWYILLAPPELVLITTLVGTIPIVIVCILYFIILYTALKKVVQLKNATAEATRSRNPANSNPVDIPANNGLRIFRGSNVRKTTNDEQLSDPEAPVKSRSFLNKIFCTGNKKSSRIINPHVQNGNVNKPSKRKAIKVVLFTTGSFVITWVPYFIACTMYIYCNPDKNPSYCYNLRIAIASPLAILGFANSLLNPLIYAWWHNGFRESFKIICCAKFCTKKSTPNDGTTNNSNQIDRRGTTSSTNTLSTATAQ